MPLPCDIRSFADFWPVYLGEHTDARCRFVHYVAAVAVLAIVATAVATQRWWMLWSAPVAAYGLAWCGHFFFERNRPATWSYPWWSLRAEWRMFFLAMTGRLQRHLAAAKVACPEPRA